MQPFKQLGSMLLSNYGKLLQAYPKLPHAIQSKTFIKPSQNTLTCQGKCFHFASFPKALPANNYSLKNYSTTTEMLMDPKCKVAIVTGAATGTGYNIAKKLLCCGMKVFLVDIDGAEGKKAMHVLGEQFGQGSIMFYHGDMACEGHIHALLRRCIDHFGAINILINHASVIDASNWSGETDINFGAVVKAMEISFDHLTCDKGVPGGFILNMSSTFALKPFPSQPTYCGSRRAILGLHQSYSDPFYYRERNIRMAVLCAGPTNTAKIEKGKNNLPTRELQDEYDRVMAYECKQSPEAVGAAVTKMVCHAPHGSTWVVENGELFMINYPPYTNCRVQSTVRKLCD